MGFVPDKNDAGTSIHIPFYEDQADAKIPGRGTDKTPEQLQSEILDLMTKLGAYNVLFVSGKSDEKPVRYGYRITFMASGHPGRIDVAALPMRAETPARKQKALAQALYGIRNWLESEVFSQYYRPGNIPLLPYMIGEGNLTVNESITQKRELLLQSKVDEG